MITKQEIHWLIGVVFVLISVGLMEDSIKNFVISTFPISPFLLGLIILVGGLYFLKIK